MQYLEWIARDKIERFRSQLAQIKSSELRLRATDAALRAVSDEITTLEVRLDETIKIENGTDFLKNLIITLNQKIYAFTTYLGILLRSTNLRNCLEAQHSFEELSSALLDQPDKLIISSEWDAVPFYIPDPPHALSSFVFIGMPAYSSRNSLMLPLAAHELGHAIWRIRHLDGPIVNTAELYLDEEIDRDLNLFYRKFNIDVDLFAESIRDEIVSDCLKLVESQSQELFCDAIGANIFGESYYYAFEFFIAPGFGARDPKYPSLQDRVTYIRKVIADCGGVLKQTGAFDAVLSEQKTVSPLLEYADLVVSRLKPAILETARNVAARIAHSAALADTTEALKQNLMAGTPPNDPVSLVAILNAAWQVMLERQEGVEDLGTRHKITRLMNNLCLKSLEIYEYNRLLKV